MPVTEIAFLSLIEQIQKLDKGKAIKLESSQLNDLDDVQAQKIAEALVEKECTEVIWLSLNFVYKYVSGTPLVVMSSLGKTKTVEWLLKPTDLGGGGASIQERDSKGNTVFLWAAFSACDGNGYRENIKWLLKPIGLGGGASIHEANNEGKTAYMLATENYQRDIAAYIKQNEDYSPLLVAAANGDLKSLRRFSARETVAANNLAVLHHVLSPPKK